MRNLFTMILLMTLMLQSCNLFYHQVQLEVAIENNIVTTKEKKLKNSGSTCLSKEITTQKDALNNQITYKEVVTHDCRGAYSHEVKRKTWTVVNGKKVAIVSKK